MVALGGPTGSGKSELALHLAAQCDGEIVNFDSLQVFRGFDIGTAKLPEAERQSIPHHLLDIRDGSELYTAGDFVRDADRAVRSIAARGRLPVLVGGTGFYLKALLEGLSSSPGRDDSLRAALQAREQKKPGSLHRLLRRIDPAAAKKIHGNDSNKTLRALELRLLLRKSGAEHFVASPPRAPSSYKSLLLVLDPPRAQLRARLDARCESIWSSGLTLEVEQLLDSGIPPDSKPFASLGYKQALAFLRGECSRQDALEEMKIRTRQYAKRQLTWFRNQHNGITMQGFGAESHVKDQALQLVIEWLRANDFFDPSRNKSSR